MLQAINLDIDLVKKMGFGGTEAAEVRQEVKANPDSDLRKMGFNIRRQNNG